MVMEHVLKPILKCNDLPLKNSVETFQLINNRIISVTNKQQINNKSQAIEHILLGDTILFIGQSETALSIGTRKVEKRAVEAPENESTVLGSQESFTDDIKINCSLIIKRLPVPNIKFEEFTVGTLSKTTVKLIWLDGIANPAIISEVRNRIQSINVENINGIGSLSELIEDKPLSIFPKYRQTERPDVAVRNLTTGHFIVICNNSPFAMIAPISLWDNFRTMDDYEERSFIGSYLSLSDTLHFLYLFLFHPYIFHL